MKKSTLIMILSLVLAVALGVGGTLAYLQDTDEDVNVMTLGSVYITQNEQEYNEDGELVPFTQDKPMYPAVGTPAWNVDPKTATPEEAAWRQFTGMENVVDKYVTVTNTGKSDAYVRTLVALEMGELDINAFADVFGLSVNIVDGAEFDFPGTWEIFNDGVYTINDKTYNVMTFEHQDALVPGETTIPSILQMYLKGEATTNETMEKIDGNGNGKYDVLVLSQAVQTQGFADATTALNTAFGEINQDNVQEWFANIGKNIGSPGDKWLNNNPPAEFTGDPAELYKLLSEASDAGSGDVTIDLTESYDMTGYDWKSIKVDGYHGADIVTVNGNGNYIKGLNAPLYSSGFAGGCGVVINDLTIMDSKMQAPTDQGSGAFICCVDSMNKITLKNCHAINVELNGKSRTGGLIGWTSGYSNVNDGPVKTYVTIDGCTVKNCTINAETESAGGFIGHSGASDWTYTTVTNSAVIDTVINGGSDRTGIFLGTSNVGETTFTDCTYENVTGTLNEDHVLYGRTAHGSTGKLVIDDVEIN